MSKGDARSAGGAGGTKPLRIEPTHEATAARAAQSRYGSSRRGKRQRRRFAGCTNPLRLERYDAGRQTRRRRRRRHESVMSKGVAEPHLILCGARTREG